MKTRKEIAFDVLKALEFMKANKEVAFATVGEGNRPMIRVFQIMKFDGNDLYFATGPHKRVFSELQENPAVEVLSHKDNISVRVSGTVVFDVPDSTQREIYDTNPVLSRLYPNYKSLTYFRLPIGSLDYYDLTPTPPVQWHFDAQTGEYTDLNPYGSKK